MADSTPHRQLGISDTVRRYNEDIYSIVDGAAWVLDGATGVTDETYTDNPSDGHWYVQRFDEYLRQNVRDTSCSLTEHVANAIEEIDREFGRIAPGESIDTAAEPSATCAIVRWVDGVLEHYVLCDSTFLLLGDSGVVTFETDRRIETIETQTKEKLRRLKRTGLSLEDARQQLMPELRENRRRKNTDGDYWVLSFDPAAAREGITGEHDLTRNTTVYLYTDGFARLVDTYDAYPDWGTAIRTVQRQGVESSVEEIRNVEREDPQADEHLRLKQSDDTTVVKLAF
jgi:hypothetical protein